MLGRNEIKVQRKLSFFLLTLGGAKWDKVHQKEASMERRVTTEMEELLNAGAFVGNYTHSLDGKKRVTIPADWRDAAGNPTLFVLPGVNFKCLYARWRSASKRCARRRSRTCRRKNSCAISFRGRIGSRWMGKGASA